MAAVGQKSSFFFRNKVQDVLAREVRTGQNKSRNIFEGRRVRELPVGDFRVRKQNGQV